MRVPQVHVKGRETVVIDNMKVLQFPPLIQLELGTQLQEVLQHDPLYRM